MTVTFENKSDGSLFVHEDVNYMQAGETLYGSPGWGLHFNDNTYCFVNEETFRFVAAST